ncbi:MULTISPECIES: Arc family DNA-binding protein [unclassified Methylobacterium]|uniref:Arc family DNA-binding protein n=1 Tax=unclassified Methylobacterium TaxID=2615210 RepID=UPI00164F4C8C|nr:MULTISPECIES: Arc family DNA-binding protein [unclassified Methylobacterium]
MSTESTPEPKRRGRPPKPAAERKSDNFKFRARGSIRDQLEASASKNSRSLSEEIEFRIGQSFNYNDIHDAVDDGFTRNMRLLFGGADHTITMIELAGYLRRSIQAADTQVDSDEPWFSNDLKKQIVEDTFVHLAKRALKGAAARAQEEAKSLKP